MRVQLAGKGSGNMQSDGTEGAHGLALSLNAATAEALALGKGLAENLVSTVKEQFQKNPLALPGGVPSAPPAGVPTRR